MNWPEVLAPFANREIDLQVGARTELFNYSAGIPVLTSSFCKRVWDNVEDGASVSNEKITQIAEGFVDDGRSILDVLWEDYDAEEQGIAANLALESTAVSRDCLVKLQQRGFVYEDWQVLKLCRPLEQYIKAYRPQAAHLRSLFGEPEDYLKNIKSVIELRAIQLHDSPSVDEQLKEYVRAAVHKLDQPYLVVNEIRGLINRAFNLIWDRELPDRRIPPLWTEGLEEWKTVTGIHRSEIHPKGEFLARLAANATS